MGSNLKEYFTEIGFDQNLQLSGGDGDNINYDVAEGGSVTDAGAIKGTFALANALLDFTGEQLADQREEGELERDFALNATRTEAAQRAADRNEIIRLGLPFAAVAVIGATYFIGKK